VEEIKGPFERILIRLERPSSVGPLREAWRDATKNAAPFLRDAEWEVRLRLYEFARLNVDASRQETLAVGARVGFTSGLWRDRVRVGGALHTSQRVHGPRDRDGLGMLRSAQTGVTALGEAWVGVELAEGVELRAYRQALDLPYLNGNDSRMIPNTFEALMVQGRGEYHAFAVGHVTRMKPRDEGHFDSMTRVAGADRDRGLSVVGARFEPWEGFEFGAIDLLAWDAMNVVYSEARLTHTLASGLGLQLALQWTWQHSVGRAVLGDFATYQGAAKLSVSYEGIVVSAAWGSTDTDAGIRSPWGGRPGFLSLMRSDFDRAGERSWLVGISYDFARIGWSNWSGFARFAKGSGARDTGTGAQLLDDSEVDVTLDYRPEDGRWHGLWLRLRAGWLDSNARREARDIRLIVNYDLPI
jgi:hypothetical protein